MPGSWSFNGAGAKISAPDSATLRTPSTALTVAGWVKWVGESADWTGIISKFHNPTGPYNSWALQQFSWLEGQANLGFADGANWRTVQAAQQASGVWLFVVGSADASGSRIRVWGADGTLLTDVAGPAIGAALSYGDHPFVLGQGEEGTRFWQGKLAHVGAHNAILTDEQLATWRTTGVPPITLSAIFVPLDSVTAADTAQGNPLTVTDAVYDPDDGPPVTPPGVTQVDLVAEAEQVAEADAAILAPSHGDHRVFDADLSVASAFGDVAEDVQSYDGVWLRKDAPTEPTVVVVDLVADAEQVVEVDAAILSPTHGDHRVFDADPAIASAFGDTAEDVQTYDGVWLRKDTPEPPPYLDMVADAEVASETDVTLRAFLGMAADTETVAEADAALGVLHQLVVEAETVGEADVALSRLLGLVAAAEIVSESDASLAAITDLLADAEIVTEADAASATLLRFVAEAEHVSEADAGATLRLHLVVDAEQVHEADTEIRVRHSYVASAEVASEADVALRSFVGIVTEVETAHEAIAELRRYLGLSTDVETVLEADAVILVPAPVNYVVEAETVTEAEGEIAVGFNVRGYVIVGTETRHEATGTVRELIVVGTAPIMEVVGTHSEREMALTGGARG